MVNTIWESGPVNTNRGPSPVNTNLGPEPWAGAERQGVRQSRGPGKGPGTGKYKDLIILFARTF